MNAKDMLKKGMAGAGEKLDELKAEAESALKKGKSALESSAHEAEEKVKGAFGQKPAAPGTKKPGA